MPAIDASDAPMPDMDGMELMPLLDGSGADMPDIDGMVVDEPDMAGPSSIAGAVRSGMPDGIVSR